MALFAAGCLYFYEKTNNNLPEVNKLRIFS